MDVRKYDKLTKIHINPHSIGEISAGQKLKHDDVVGMVSSSLLTLEYHKMKGEYLKELKKARTVAQKAKVRTLLHIENQILIYFLNYGFVPYKNTNPYM